MRSWILVGMALSGIVSGTASRSVADETKAERRYVSAIMKLPGSDAIREFYPRKAKEFGIEAVAATDCEILPNGSLTDCIGFGETVPGYEFNAATAAMFEKYASVDMTTLSGGFHSHDRITHSFEWHLSLLTAPQGPDKYDDGPAHTSVARYVKGQGTYPTQAQMTALYPAKAAQAEIEGDVTIECSLAASGNLDSCTTVAETPQGYGFGQATRDLFLKFYHLDPATVEGGVKPGDRMRFTLHWAQ